MPLGKVTIHSGECDGCGATVYGTEDERPFGYEIGNVFLVGVGGGTGCSSVFACSKGCIVKAIDKGIQSQ